LNTFCYCCVLVFFSSARFPCTIMNALLCRPRNIVQRCEKKKLKNSLILVNIEINVLKPKFLFLTALLLLLSPILLFMCLMSQQEANHPLIELFQGPHHLLEGMLSPASESQVGLGSIFVILGASASRLSSRVASGSVSLPLPPSTGPMKLLSLQLPTTFPDHNTCHCPSPCLIYAFY
jgi:hypothetical protein